jgi:hypothetical protein
VRSGFRFLSWHLLGTYGRLLGGSEVSQRLVEQRGSPPSTNRGAVLTPAPPDLPLTCGVHWLAATIPEETGVDLQLALDFISEELYGADWSTYERGVNG